MDALELHIDAFKPGDRVLILDDLLATGGTAKAAGELVKKLKGNIVELAYLIELIDLGGAKKFEQVNNFSILKI